MSLAKLRQGLAMAGQKVASAVGLREPSSGSSGQQESEAQSFGLEFDTEDEEASGSEPTSEQEQSEDEAGDEATSPPRPADTRRGNARKQPTAAVAEQRCSSRQPPQPAAAAEPAPNKRQQPRRSSARQQPQPAAAERSDEEMEDAEDAASSEDEAPQQQPAPTSRNTRNTRGAKQAQPEAAAADGGEEEEEEQRGRKRRPSCGKRQQQQRGGGKRKQPAAAAAAAEDTAMAVEEQPPAKRTRRGGQPAVAVQPLKPQPQQLEHEEEEEEEEELLSEVEGEAAPEQQQQRAASTGKKTRRGCRGKKNKSGRGKQQQPQQQPSPAAAPAPASEQQQQEQQVQKGALSPTPAAAAEGQQLEMSVPPEQGQEGAAAEGGQEQWAAAEWRPADPTNPAAAASDLLLRRLMHPRSKEAGSMPLRPRAQEACEALLDSLTNTVELGHNNSLLVVGPRGCGKTLVAERALAALQARYNTDPADPVVGVVRLSGTAHADERTAFKEIARQLCDTFSGRFSRSASVEENIVFLRAFLPRLASCDKAAVFLLDDFDLFAAKRAKQTLLYNLLDALQTSGMQAAVVGLTCRQDVVETLEKRVKSRFSHRKLDLSLPTSVLPVVPRADEDGGGMGAGAVGRQDGALDVLKAMLTLPPSFEHPQWAERWNASVREAAEAAEVKQALQLCINVYPSLRSLASLADWALLACLGGGRLSAKALRAAAERQLDQAKGMVHGIAALPILDLALLVAAHRLTARGSEDLNFEMAHTELNRFMAVGQHVDNYSKQAAAKAWDHLLDQGLAAFIDTRSEARVGLRAYAPAYLLVTREEVEEGLRGHGNCPQALTEWFKREGGLGTTAAQFL